MKIPDKLKVGGITYNVKQTNNLTMGTVNCSAEIDYLNCTIKICPNNVQKMEADFCHEMVHAILANLGYTEHDEKEVDEFGKALYMIFRDNPKMFDSAKEKDEQ